MLKLTIPAQAFDYGGPNGGFLNNNFKEQAAKRESRHDDCMYYHLVGSSHHTVAEAEKLCEDPEEQDWAYEGLRKWDTEYIGDMLEWCESRPQYCPRYVGPDHKSAY
jgi:hypothetical protein